MLIALIVFILVKIKPMVNKKTMYRLFFAFAVALGSTIYFTFKNNPWLVTVSAIITGVIFIEWLIRIFTKRNPQ